MRLIFPVSLLMLSFLLTGAVVSTSVGQVRDHIVTSREVSIHFYLEKALYGANKSLTQLQVPPLESSSFASEVNSVLMERVISLEAQNFAAATVSSQEISEAIRSVTTHLKGVKDWKNLEPTSSEIREMLSQMLQAKKFIKFKAESSSVPVTDSEAKQYFEENQLRFGNLPFENFKENIKTYLTRTQTDKRLKDWFEVLQAKYKVRNFLSEI